MTSRYTINVAVQQTVIYVLISSCEQARKTTIIQCMRPSYSNKFWGAGFKNR